MAGVAERGGEDTAGNGSGEHEAGGRQGRTKGAFTRHSRKYVFFFIWIQLAVEVVRGRLKVQVRGIRAKIVFLYLDIAGSRPGEREAGGGEGWTKGTFTRHPRKYVYFSVFGHS
jgi:hypothetical protein